MEELTFPDCPTCANKKSETCRFSDVCKTKVLEDGTRYETPTHFLNKNKKRADTN